MAPSGAKDGATLGVGDKTISNIVCNNLGPLTPLAFLSDESDDTFGALLLPSKDASNSCTIAIDPLAGLAFSTVALDSTCTRTAGTCTVTKQVRDPLGNLIATLTSLNGAPSTPFSFTATGRANVIGAGDPFTQRRSNARPPGRGGAS